jgi:hypothetical protein
MQQCLTQAVPVLGRRLLRTNVRGSSSLSSVARGDPFLILLIQVNQQWCRRFRAILASNADKTAQAIWVLMLQSPATLALNLEEILRKVRAADCTQAAMCQRALHVC